MAARLKLSNKARKRLACAADPDAPANPREIAYFLGSECAIDRLLLASEPGEAAAIARWKAPKLPIGGGALIRKGLKQGPEVAKTLQAIERRWVKSGFPSGAEFDRIVDEALSSS